MLSHAVCFAGEGTTNSTAPAANTELPTCSKCNEGFFGDDNRAAGDTECKPCPNSAAHVFNFWIDGDAHPLSVKGTTEAGASSAEQCLLEFSAVQVANW
jgi:hypothetical protein